MWKFMTNHKKSPAFQRFFHPCVVLSSFFSHFYSFSSFFFASAFYLLPFLRVTCIKTPKIVEVNIKIYVLLLPSFFLFSSSTTTTTTTRELLKKMIIKKVLLSQEDDVRMMEKSSSVEGNYLGCSKWLQSSWNFPDAVGCEYTEHA